MLLGYDVHGFERIAIHLRLVLIIFSVNGIERYSKNIRE